MLRFCLLASGSKGNAVYVEGGGAAVLIDAGVSARQIMLRMAAAGLDPARLQAIVLTHEHRDHTAGVRVLAQRLGLPVLATAGTWAGYNEAARCQHSPLAAGLAVEVGGLRLTPFTTPHDAADPVGLVLEAGGVRLGLATDLGQATNLVRQRLLGCHGLILEANHDPAALANGPYPAFLKQRIKGRMGHLCNDDACGLLADVHHAELEAVVMAHLSETNNTPELARSAAAAMLRRLGGRAALTVAGQHRPTGVITLGGDWPGGVE